MSEQQKSSNVVWYQATVTRARRESQNGHHSVILWFTGLSGAGKSTLAHAVEEELHTSSVKTFVFDGDNVRHGLCSDLGFSDEDRVENIRRIGEMSRLIIEAGVVAMTAFISPFRADRQKVRNLVGDGDFIEVYCRASVEECEKRDVKGLYAKARAGEIQNFTGVSSPYEEPTDAELVVDTGSQSLEECVNQVLSYLEEHGVIASAQQQALHSPRTIEK